MPDPVAVPVTAKLTVTFCAETADKLTVTALVATDSAPLELVNSKSTTGGLSLSVMV